MYPDDADPARALQRRLELALAGAQPARTVIALSASGRRTIAAICEGCPEDEIFRTGCTTKLLVAALLERKLGALGVNFDVPARRLLGTAAEVLGETTARHLLEHTHGLDDSNATQAPLRTDGSIDVERLLHGLEGRRIAAPGELYSYSNAGAIILAAALESLDGRRFDVLLRDDLLAPLGIDAKQAAGPGASGSAGICAATGNGLALTVGGLLRFLEANAAASIFVDADRRAAPLPGWHPLERGVRLGWKCYAGGWLGHQSVWPDASLFLCARPSDRSAVVVASEGHHAAVVAARVLGRSMPELFAPRMPRRLSPSAAARLDPSRYSGSYVSAAERVVVEAGSNGLVLESDGGRARLVPAAGEIFFLDPGARGRSFVQFIRRARGGRRRLWDGRRVFTSA